MSYILRKIVDFTFSIMSDSHITKKNIKNQTVTVSYTLASVFPSTEMMKKIERYL